jgi:hypothetical protein
MSVVDFRVTKSYGYGVRECYAWARGGLARPKQTPPTLPFTATTAAAAAATAATAAAAAATATATLAARARAVAAMISASAHITPAVVVVVVVVVVAAIGLLMLHPLPILQLHLKHAYESSSTHMCCSEHGAEREQETTKRERNEVEIRSISQKKRNARIDTKKEGDTRN